MTIFNNNDNRISEIIIKSEKDAELSVRYSLLNDACIYVYTCRKTENKKSLIIIKKFTKTTKNRKFKRAKHKKK